MSNDSMFVSMASPSDENSQNAPVKVNGGYAVEPKRDCPHVLDENSVTTTSGESLHQMCKNVCTRSCGNCSEKSENWMCLKCGDVFCSRYINSHMADHCDQTQENDHCIVVSFSDLSFWCYKCDSYIEHPVLRTVRTVVYGEKEKSVGTPNFVKDTALKEHFDTEDDVRQAVKRIAARMSQANHCVVYTGAGISTSASIPDYRGPQGIWTLKEQGRLHEAKRFDIEMAYPTYAHYALNTLLKNGKIQYVVSTNVDGLHRRSGIKVENLAELHGNCFREICTSCEEDYLRGFDVTKSVKDYTKHVTGRKCDSCGGVLKDTIIHFNENLSQKELIPAVEHSEKADMTLVLGTSMRVRPACNLPMANPHADMYIVNLQLTPYDNRAKEVVHAKTDMFMQLLLEELGLADQVDQSYDELEEIRQREASH